jgi:hypothetical protein
MALRTRPKRSIPSGSRGPDRDPANELYDEACALLAAAQGVRAAAGPRRSAPAIAASLGCVEASLEALATAVTVMRVAALETVAEVPSTGDPLDREAPQVRAGLDRLARDLEASRLSCAAAREVVGPVLVNR